jgi:hypothetical protein
MNEIPSYHLTTAALNFKNNQFSKGDEDYLLNLNANNLLNNPNRLSENIYSKEKIYSNSKKSPNKKRKEKP